MVHHHELIGHQLSTSRRHRKGLPPLTVDAPDVAPGEAVQGLSRQWRHLWAPRRIGWWIAILFMIGAAHFAIASAAALWPQSLLLDRIAAEQQGWIYFVGAVFFTSAGFLQWLEAHNNDVVQLTLGAEATPRPWRLFGWCPRNLGYLAALIQFIGTLLFNLNTSDALIAGLSQEGQDLLVWTPDVLGSICFLISSQFAFMEVSHKAWSWQPRNLSWWIAVINLLGSIFFMASALAAFVIPGPQLADPELANLGTFAGALCFLIAAYLLIPELFESEASPASKKA